MTEAKHTPGPWHGTTYIDPSSIAISSEDREERSAVPVCEVSVGFNEPFNGEQIANARLIAAAPDMLEAAKNARTVILNFVEAHGDSGASLIIRQLDSAIAKATGAP